MDIIEHDKVVSLNVFVSAVTKSSNLNWTKILKALCSPYMHDYSLISSAILRHTNAPWVDAWSKGQLMSKLWLIEELGKVKNDFLCVYVIGGWLGVLPWLMFRDNKITARDIRSFDIDPSCYRIADDLNIDSKINNWRFKAVTMDANAMKFSSDGYYNFIGEKANGNYSKAKPEKPDCIINTSCDHFSNLHKWIEILPHDVLIVLQNTNVSHDDTHVNCVNDIDEFINQSNLKNIFFSGTLDCGNYKRFMIIGKK